MKTNRCFCDCDGLVNSNLLSRDGRNCASANFPKKKKSLKIQSIRLNNSSYEI